MKKIIDKIIVFIFYFLCFFAFFAVIVGLPENLNYAFGTNMFDNAYGLSFIFCTFIVVYMLIYYNNEKDKETSASLKIRSSELQTVNNINNFNYSTLNNIESISLTPSCTLTILLKNSYEITDIKIINFFPIDNQQKLNDLDNNIGNISQSINTSQHEISIISKYKTEIENYLHTIKENITEEV